MKLFERVIVISLIICLPNILHIFSGLLCERLGILCVAITIFLLLFAACTYKFFIKPQPEICVSATDIYIGLYLLYGLINIVFVNAASVDLLFILRWLTMLGGYVVFRMISDKQFVLLGFLLSGLIQSVSAYLQYAGYMQSNHTYFTVTGSFGNPGQLAGYLAFSFMSTILLLCTTNGKSPHKVRIPLLWLALVIIGGALLLSDSRAGWLSAIISAITYTTMYYKFKFTKYISKYKLHKLTIILSASVVIIVGTVCLYSYKESSALGRLLIWNVSADMVIDKPLLGHGIGTFQAKYMPYQAQYFAQHNNSVFNMLADNVAYPYNEFIHILVEQGLIGFMLFCLILFSVFSYGKSSEMRYSLLALLIYSLFSYPSNVFSLLFLFAICLGSITTRALFKFVPNRIIRCIVCVLLSICLLLSVKTLMVFDSDNRAIDDLYITRTPLCMDIYERQHKSALFMDVYAQWGVNHMPEDQILPIMLDASKVTSSSELYCDIGTTYQLLHNSAKAEDYYKVALNMIPHRVTPPYHLFKLYWLMGDTLSARKYAERILSAPVKTSGTATLRIQSEANAFLHTLK